MDRLIQRITDAYRRHSTVAAYAVCAAIAIGALIILGTWKVAHSPTEVAEVVNAPSAPVPLKPERYLLSASEPVRITIPKLSLLATFEPSLGLKPDRTIEVPEAYDTVGWYNGSPTPGELGPAIILGHVDSYKGAAVFYHLGRLVPGDTFEIERADGSKPTFVVEKLERYSQDDFPTDLVYGPIDHAGIRLITCSGTYDKGTLRYSHNLVVYGRLVDPATREMTASSTP